MKNEGKNKMLAFVTASIPFYCFSLPEFYLCDTLMFFEMRFFNAFPNVDEFIQLGKEFAP